MNKNIKEAYESLEEDYMKISKDYLALEESNIEAALIRHTSIYAFFSSVLTHAKRVKDLKSITLETSEAKVMNTIREAALQAGEKITQGALNTYILMVPELVELREEVVDADTKYNLSKNIVSALDHQKDLLVQLSANKRAEMKLHEL